MRRSSASGTPIEKTDANTRAVFGEYISIYDIYHNLAISTMEVIEELIRLAKEMCYASR